MPSPFPGMDPFLEHPDIFPDLHDSLVATLREFLNARLPEPYFARLGRRVWVEISKRFIGPDVNVLRPNGDNGSRESSGGVAVADMVRSQPVVIRVPHDELRETFVEIYTGQDGKRLVTSLEVLRLSNKTPGQHSQELYRRKQQEVLKSKMHLVEIDLLRAGAHSTAVPLELALEKTGLFDYHVCVHGFDRFEDYLVYPIRLQDPLPEIMIPLLPEHQPVLLSLQEVFDHCYEKGAYQREVRYRESAPVPPLRKDQEDWVAERLRLKGIIPDKTT